MEITIGKEVLRRSKKKAIEKIKEKKNLFAIQKRNKAERSWIIDIPQHIDSTSMRRRDI